MVEFFEYKLNKKSQFSSVERATCGTFKTHAVTQIRVEN